MLPVGQRAGTGRGWYGGAKDVQGSAAGHATAVLCWRTTRSRIGSVVEEREWVQVQVRERVEMERAPSAGWMLLRGRMMGIGGGGRSWAGVSIGCCLRMGCASGGLSPHCSEWGGASEQEKKQDSSVRSPASSLRGAAQWGMVSGTEVRPDDLNARKAAEDAFKLLSPC